MRPIHQKRGRGGHLGGRRPQNVGTHRNLDSNGPDIKIRGTASHIFDRYCQLARDANASGDRIAAENYLQHAEHYYRMLLANGAIQPRHNGQPAAPSGNGQGQAAQTAQSASAGGINADPSSEDSAA